MKLRYAVIVSLLALTPPVAKAQSADFAYYTYTVPSGPAIVDASANSWTVAANESVYRNGVYANGAGSKLVLVGGAIYALGLDSNWWQYTGPSTWVSTYSAVEPAIVDNGLKRWTIGSTGTVLRDGVTTNGAGSSLLWLQDIMYTLGGDTDWWRFIDNQSLGISWVSTGSATAPPPHPSPDGTHIPSSQSIFDNALQRWTIASNGTILRDGISSNGAGTELLWLENVMYTRGTNGDWYKLIDDSWPGWQHFSAVTPQRTSLNGTQISAASPNPIIDKDKAIWQIVSTDYIHLNGASVGRGTKISFLDGVIYALGTNNQWYSWDAGWTLEGYTKPESIYGPQQAACPMGAVTIATNANIQDTIDLNNPGTVYCLLEGVHYIDAAIVPQEGDSIHGEAGAILSGALDLSALTWLTAGPNYKLTGQALGTAVPGGGECTFIDRRCDFTLDDSSVVRSPDLFIDDQPLVHVDSLGALGPGKWFFDDANDTIYLSYDPDGQRVEISVTPQALTGEIGTNTFVDDVTVRNLVIEKFATPTREKAVRPGEDWIVEYNNIRLNHGVGLSMGGGNRVLHNMLSRNGQLGLAGGGTGALVETNEIAYNNYADHAVDWEAGGTKITYSTDIDVIDNFVHHNNGNGLWFDIENSGTTYEDNVVEDNARAGIFHEISDTAVIRYNVVRRNGFGAARTINDEPGNFGTDGAGAGILIGTSTNVEVHDNLVEDNLEGIVGTERSAGVSHALENLDVHDNTVIQLNQPLRNPHGRTGIWDFTGTDAFGSTKNNAFKDNTYYLPDNTRKFFMWQTGNVGDSAWDAIEDSPIIIRQ